MKAIVLMFDSLNRRMLPPYGCEWVHAPNFQRLADRTVTFENSYVGSMPCMPSRRELHTGRYNFLHRSWGPLEPFDDSMPQLLHENGIHTHLISDHYHYWEDGGATYHNRFSSWEISRGQEGDPWKADLRPVVIPEKIGGRPGKRDRQDWTNRIHMPTEAEHCQTVTFNLGEQFLRANAAQDNWMLQIETFDPHEPFFTYEQYQALYPHDYHGPHFDWPDYAPVKETPEQIQHLRFQYAALLSMCDHSLGRVLDLMDELDLWKDTLLVVNTDHGFLLSEHDWWAKCVQPFYNEVAHTPLFIWHPRQQIRGQRRASLVQTIDLPATLLHFFGLPLPPHMQGHPLDGVLADDTPVREAGLYGLHGGQVNVTDGRYVYMRAPARPENSPLFNYTLMPTHMNSLFPVSELQEIGLAEPFSFTKGCRTLRIPTPPDSWSKQNTFGTLLFDLKTDPGQQHPIQDETIEARMVAHLRRLMQANDAPPEQFERLGLELG
jgi:arylsulfatase A-like enzyme